MGRKTVFEIGSDISKKLTGMTDPMGRKTTWSCDSLCSISTTVLPDGKEIKHYYDALCQLNKVVYPDGSMVLYEYDEMGRRTAVTGAGWLYGEEVYGGKTYGSGTYGGFKYGEKILYGFNPANTIYYEYDAGNRLTKISYPDPGGSEIRKDITYQYDDGDRITKITDIAGYEQIYVYDDEQGGRVSSVTKHNKTVTYHYDDDNYGRLDYFTLPNGIKKEFIFNDDDEFTGMKYTKNSGTTILYQFDYEYDSDTGNIIKQTITKPDGTQTVNNYNYDSLNRLVSVMKNGQKQTWYDFDAMGNRLKKWTPDGVLHYQYNACDELICQDGIKFKYDLNGNMIEKNDPVEGKTQYTYNSAGRLSKVLFPDNTESKYVYDYKGLMVSKISKTGSIVNYYWDRYILPNVLNECNNEGDVIQTNFENFGFKSTYNNKKWRFFITDHLGSVIALSNEEGDITDEYQYNEYGKYIYSKGNSYNNYHYINQYWDDESDLIYLRNRFYDPNIGKFISKDPIGLIGGINLYLYSENNVINMYDLNGTESGQIQTVPYTSNPHGGTVSLVSNLAWRHVYPGGPPYDKVMVFFAVRYENIDPKSCYHEVQYYYDLSPIIPGTGTTRQQATQTIPMSKQKLFIASYRVYNKTKYKGEFKMTSAVRVKYGFQTEPIGPLYKAKIEGEASKNTDEKHAFFVNYV